jgi:hypothetical protein
VSTTAETEAQLRSALLAASISDWDLGDCAAPGEPGEGRVIEIHLDDAVRVVTEYVASRETTTSEGEQQ